MLGYVVRRAGLSIFVLWGAVTIIFLVVRFVPGDPVALMLGVDTSIEQIERVQAQYGLDQPVLAQYGRFLVGVVNLDFGDSIRMGQPALELVLGRVPATLRLALAAMLIAIMISIPLGLIAARQSRTPIDTMISKGSLLGQSLPSFWVSIMLLLIFSRQLGWLPSFGAETWRHTILPAVALSLPFLAILIRLVRQGVLEVLSKDYVETARSKGLPEHTIMSRHVLKNTMIPVVTVIGLQFGEVLTGAIIVETVFAWPGIGSLLISAIETRDYPVVQSAMFLITFVFVLVNFLVDILYGYLDPRVRVEE